MDIHGAAMQVVRKYHTNNPFEICQAMKIPVQYGDLGLLNGFYHYYKRNRFIWINENLDEVEQRAICAHELGHAIMHKKENRIFLNSSLYSASKYEKEADIFSGYLLWNDRRIEDYEGYTLDQIAMDTRIPVHYLKMIF